MALSQFTVANGTDAAGESNPRVSPMTEQVKQAFLDRPHLVDGEPGFVRMEVISPIDAPDEIWLLTYWTDEESFRTWHRSHLYRDSHQGIPKGLKLDPNPDPLLRARRLLSPARWKT